ncbi:MAG: LPXTG cell wall anchor domain-containing protein [Bacillota bacterium]|nr:LPXTG cell wall anchor domain-containing protein [Bacillota bacterium]
MKQIKLSKNTFISMILTLALIFIIAVKPVYADDLEIVGKDIGLEVIPKDKNLFQVMNLNPGDYLSSKLTIKNNYDDTFELFMKAERQNEEPSEGEPDLYKQLLMTVTLRGKEIFKGSMIDFAKGNDISLGKFEPGDIEEMAVNVSLPGKETGNEFQGKKLDTKWVFTAISETTDIPDEPVPAGSLPKTGFDINSNLYTALGLLLICAGAFGLYIFRGNRKRKSKNQSK